MEARQIPAEGRGEWLRTNGLHSEHLTLWEQVLGNLMTDKQDNLKSEVRDLKKQVKDLEKELDRKEKTMAEVVALLTSSWTSGTAPSSGGPFMIGRTVNSQGSFSSGPASNTEPAQSLSIRTTERL